MRIMCGHTGGISLTRKEPNAPKSPRNKTDTTDRPKRHVRDIVCGHTEVAVATLVEIAINGKSEAARVRAATEILNRGHGRPAKEDPSRRDSILQRAVEQIQRFGNSVAPIRSNMVEDDDTSSG
jgi:hypothetical protein